MNATMINNREFVESTYAIESKVNQELLDHANSFYSEKLSLEKQKQLLGLSLEDKIWLLEQYKEEMEFITVPNFDHLY